LRPRKTPTPLPISLLPLTINLLYGYPEGNFGGNQLLGGSMSLSPLYLHLKNDLHINNSNGPPPEFPLASPCAGKVHHLSGPDIYALTQTFHRKSWSVDGAPCYQDPTIKRNHFHCACGFDTHILAYMLDSLVRVSRRVG